MARFYRPIPPITPQIERRFWSKVHRTDTCWLWTGALRNGYGAFGIGKMARGASRQYLAHRVAYTIQFGSIPDGLDVLHRCDIPNCVRHIYAGTHQENMRDRNVRQRVAVGERNGRRTRPETTARGERNGKSKLSTALVRYIRTARTQGVTTVALAKELNMNASVISRVANRKVWTHVA